MTDPVAVAEDATARGPIHAAEVMTAPVVSEGDLVGRGEAAPAAAEPKVDAADFRGLVEDHQHGEAEHHEEARRAAAQQRRERVAALIETHVLDDGWKQILNRAREAAEAGEKQCLLMRFPSELCIDGGRTINISDPGWPASLRGRPAEFYLRWERDLKPRGFRLSAQVLDFPGGKPGDIGLFLSWGE